MKKESKKVYLVQFWDDGREPSERIIHKIVDLEQKAKDIVKEFPTMFYDEYEVE